MKIAPLMYLTLILFTAMIFAVVYNSYKDIVETYPAIFSIGLVSVLLVGVHGIMDSIVFDQAHSPNNTK